MLINREGRFRAYVLDAAVGESGTSKLTTVTMSFALVEEYENGGWRDIAGENVNITGWFYVEKKNGDVNEFQIKQLRDAFPAWDGADIFWFEDTDLSTCNVQVEVKSEEYNGAQKLKIAYLHSNDSDPERRAKKSDPETRRSVNARLGAKLRSIAPAPAPKPIPASAPAQPATPIDELWEYFCSILPDNFTQAKKEAAWFSTFAEMFPDKKISELTADELAMFRAECSGYIIPF